MKRIALLLLLLLGLAACCPAQSSDISGAWIPVKLHWAPSESFGTAAHTTVLYFVADGSFAMINGTISKKTRMGWRFPLILDPCLLESGRGPARG